MLLDSHYLYGIISVGMHAGKHIFAEFFIRTHLLGVLTHAYVALIYQQWFYIGLEFLSLELIRSHIPHLRRENGCLFVLHHATGIGGYAFATSTGPIDAQFIEVAVVYLVGIELYFPHSVAYIAKAVSLTFHPIVECTHHIDGCGIWCPFAKYPAVGCAMEAKVVVRIGKVAQTARFAHKFGLFSYYVFMAAVDCIGKRFKPWVILDNGENFLFHNQSIRLRLYYVYTKVVQRSEISNSILAYFSKKIMFHSSVGSQPLCLPHVGHFEHLPNGITSKFMVSALNVSSRPVSNLPVPVIHFIASVACSVPVMPGITPSTPTTLPEGTSPGAGGSGKRQR